MRGSDVNLRHACRLAGYHLADADRRASSFCLVNEDTPCSDVQYSSPKCVKTVRDCVVISSASASLFSSQKQRLCCCPVVLRRVGCFGDGNGCSCLFGFLSLPNGAPLVLQQPWSTKFARLRGIAMGRHLSSSANLVMYYSPLRCALL